MHHSIQEQLLKKSLRLSLVIVSLGVFITFFFAIIREHGTSGWTSLRLVRSFALSLGLPAFYPSGTGPLMAGLNGPAFVLGYLPAAWVSNIPSQATLLGGLLTAFYFFAPALILLSWVYKKISFELGFFSFITFAFFAWESPSLSYSAREVHGGALAVGFGLFAVWILAKNRTFSRSQFIWVSLFTLLSVLSKVVLAPILFSIPVGVFICWGRRAFLNFLLTFLMVGLAVLGVIAVFFGLDSLVNAVGVAKGVHWVKSPGDFNFFSPPAVGWMGRSRILVSCLSELIRANPLILSLSCAFFCQVLFKRRALETIDPNDRLKFLLVLVGISLIPACLVSRAKFGGDLNSFTPCLYFLAIFCIIQLGDWFRQKTSFLRFLGPSLFLLLLWLTATRLPYVLKSNKVPKLKTDDLAYQLIKQNPMKWYFPFQPLAHLMAEKKVYHSFSNLIDIPKGQEEEFKSGRFKLFIPERFSAIALFQEDRENRLKEYFPGFVFLHEHRNYPGLKIFSRNQDFDFSGSATN